MANPLFIQATPGTGINNGGPSGTATFGSNVTAHNAILVALQGSSGDPGAANITTVNNDIFVLLNSFNDNTGNAVFLYGCMDAVGGANSSAITITTSVVCQFAALEYSGLATISPVDQSATNSVASGNSLSVGPTPATTKSVELLLAIAGSGADILNNYTFTAGTGYTVQVQGNAGSSGAGVNNAFAVEDQVVTSTGTYSAAMTSNHNFGGIAFMLTTLIGSSQPTTFSISGSTGHAGATVSYSGTSSGQVTADGSGNYTIPGLANGSYTITPSAAGFAFTPTSQPVTVSGSNVTGINFTSGLAVYSVPDCRDYATFPNASRNVQGTLTYDVQTSSNSAVPGDDSRAAGAPVDSRIAPNIPENSRAPQ